MLGKYDVSFTFVLDSMSSLKSIIQCELIALKVSSKWLICRSLKFSIRLMFMVLILVFKISDGILQDKIPIPHLLVKFRVTAGVLGDTHSPLYNTIHFKTI